MRYEEFNRSINSELSAKDTELSEPLIKRAKEAIEAVAKENGYTYIFNSSDGLVLYATPSDDVIDLVLKKLGVK
jgi:outer membrane protein